MSKVRSKIQILIQIFCQFNSKTNNNLAHSITKNSQLSLSDPGNKRKNASFKEDCNLERDMDAYCPFDTSSIPPECSAAQNYSFNIGKPCILIKINRVSVKLDYIIITINV